MQVHDVVMVVEEEMQNGPRNPFTNTKNFFKDKRASTMSNTKTMNDIYNMEASRT